MILFSDEEKSISLSLFFPFFSLSLSIFPSEKKPYLSLSLSFSFSLSIYLSIYISIYLSISLYLYIYLYIYLCPSFSKLHNPYTNQTISTQLNLDLFKILLGSGGNTLAELQGLLGTHCRNLQYNSNHSHSSVFLILPIFLLLYWSVTPAAWPASVFLLDWLLS